MTPFGSTMDLLKVVVDVLVVAIIIYKFLELTQGTRTLQVFLILMGVLALYLVSQERLFDLPTFRWLLDKFWSVLFLVVVILFQDDIRRGLGRFRVFDLFLKTRAVAETRTIEEVVKAARSLSAKRIGGLLALERTGSLAAYASGSGIRVDGNVSKELLFALFLPEHENPTHDGAVILSKDRVVAAGCILPLTQRTDLEPWVGTRHRAALGLSEQVDAVVVVVSEETGRISVAVRGEFQAGLSPDELRTTLLSELSGEKSAPPGLRARFKEWLQRRGKAREEPAE